jgi:Carboxypeptidase regulatory-like domain
MPIMRIVFVIGLLALTPVSAWAQSATILGTVSDASGAVLPGVVVEVASPALIEGTRSTVTDERGSYRLIELRPGTYGVTFTLPGFTTERRENVVLTTGFTATVNSSLQIGAVTENVVVTRQATQVDVVTTTVQTVMSQETLDALPLGQSLGMIRSLMPGAIAAASAQDVGGNQGESTQGFSIHGSRAGDFQQFRDGMLTNSLIAAGNWVSSQNPATIEEVVVTSGGFGALAQTGGGVINIVQREGANTFSGVFHGDFANSSLQSNNLNDALRARNARTEAEIRQRYDVAGGFGGPIVKSKLWFYAGGRRWATSSYQPNNYFNATQGTMFYTPDLSRPAYDLAYYTEANTKFTWQATPKQKVTGTYVTEHNCNCFFQLNTGTLAPEAAGSNLYDPNYRIQSTWTYPVTNRVLLWAGMTHQFNKANRMTEGFGEEGHRSILELSNNYRYNAPGSSLILPNSWGTQDSLQSNQNFSLSYTPGGHLFKVGFTTMQAIQEKDSRIADSMTYTFRDRVPQQITLWATPYYWKTRVDYLSLYVEDQWTLDRLTLNLGLRYDGLKGSVPAQNLPAGPYVPARSFDAVENTPDFSDLNPRVGAAFDLFGNGKTAVKGSVSRTVIFQAPGGLTQANNPVNAMVTSATRNWGDTNGDYIPQESELAALSNANFGRVVRNTFYDDEVIRGWHTREYSWQASASVDHEITQNLSAQFGYFRTWYGNFTVTRNQAVDPATDYAPYCVTAPSDARLPGGGGNEICGLYDLNQNRFGQVNNLVMPASRFGDQSEVYNGISVSVRGRTKNVDFAAGVTSGSTTTDRCFVVNSPQETYQCRNEEAWYARTQFKGHVVAPLPGKVELSAVLQVLPSIPLLSDYVVGNAQVQASLGRPLSGGATATRTIPLILNNNEFAEGWNGQIDFRVSRTFNLGSTIRFQPQVAVFNLLNANAVLGVVNTYGLRWQEINTVLGSRVVKFGAQVRF